MKKVVFFLILGITLLSWPLPPFEPSLVQAGGGGLCYGWIQTPHGPRSYTYPCPGHGGYGHGGYGGGGSYYEGPRYYGGSQGGRDAGAAAGGAFLGAFFGSLFGNQVAQHRAPAPPPPVQYPQPVYQSAPQVSEPGAWEARIAAARRGTTAVYVAGNDADSVRAVKEALRRRSYTLVDSRETAHIEARVTFREEGDPQARVWIEWIDLASRRIKTTSAAEFFRGGDSLRRSDAIYAAAERAVRDY